MFFSFHYNVFDYLHIFLDFFVNVYSTQSNKHTEYIEFSYQLNYLVAVGFFVDSNNVLLRDRDVPVSCERSR